jgi:spore maturation protein CgeB
VSLSISIFGSSLVSSYGNGAATYYRGLIRALHERGHRVTFYEPDVFERQQHRDLADPDWARVVVYPAGEQATVLRAVKGARGSDLILKASGVGLFDDLLDSAVLDLQSPTTLVGFLDVDAPATLARLEANPEAPFRELIPRYDFVLTQGGGEPVVRAYLAAGARACLPICSALDAHTHFTVRPDRRFAADLSFLGHRWPDREQRVDEFFLKPALKLPERSFLMGGNGWEDKPMPVNVNYLGHVYTHEHNAFNCTPLAVLNVSRESRLRYGFSPSPRVFEAAGAAACLITDPWEGLELFLEPGREVLVAHSGEEVAEHLGRLTKESAQAIGQAAHRRILSRHTYARRADELEALLEGRVASPKTKAPALSAATPK